MRIHRLVNGIAVARFVLALLVLMLLATAVDSVLTMEHTLQPLNNELTRDAYHLETSWLDLPMIGLTELGTDPPLFVFAALVAIWAYRRGQQRDGFILVGVAITARIVGVIMKYAIAQQRPFLHVPPHPLAILRGYGYPSGHSLMSSAILGFGAFVIVRLLHGSRPRTLVVLVCAALILLIGYSRVYLGFHWVNDVVGGYLYGLSIALIGGTVHLYLRGTDRLRHGRNRGGEIGPATGQMVG